MSSYYYKKYISYKNKYLKLKKQLGGTLPLLCCEGPDNFSKYTTNDMDKFHSLLSQTDRNDLRMIMGINLTYEEDRIRDMGHIDVGWGDENNQDLVNNLGDDNIKWYQINYDWNNMELHQYLAQYLKKKSPNYPKFNEIIFDSSTTKFIANPTIILYLYYILLNVGGTLYIEDIATTGGLPTITTNVPPDDILNKKVLNGSSLLSRKTIYTNKNIENPYSYTKEELMENNKSALEKILVNSTITNFYNDDNYKINKVLKYYHKIVKGNIDNIDPNKIKEISWFSIINGRVEHIYELVNPK